MLSDLRKYITTNSCLSPQEKFIRFIIEHCRVEKTKDTLIQGIRENAAQLIYEPETLFDFLNCDIHIDDVFDCETGGVSPIILAFLESIFDPDEFLITATNDCLVYSSQYYLAPITRIDDRYKASVKDIKEYILDNIQKKDREKVLRAVKDNDYEFLDDYFTECGDEETYINIMIVSFSEKIQKNNDLMDCVRCLMDILGLEEDEFGNFYYYEVYYGGYQEDHYYDLEKMINCAKEMRSILKRTNVANSAPYKDVIRIFEECGENNELISQLIRIHESKMEVLL